MGLPESCQCGAAALCLCGGVDKPKLPSPEIWELEDRLHVSEERRARAEARIVELEGTIAGLRAKMEILIYPPTAYKEYKAK